jgi:hypothetical protein
MRARTADTVVCVDGLLELFEAAIRNAMKDVWAGRGLTAKQQHNYATACTFLDQLGVLQYVQQRDADDEVLVDDLL